MKKISILYESMQSMKPDDYYRDVIVQPALRKVMMWEEVVMAYPSTCLNGLKKTSNPCHELVNPVLIFTPCFLQIHFNIIFPNTCTCPKCSLPFMSAD
jgi:hypothetical protein